MKDRNQLLKEMEEAIDRGDMGEIDRILPLLSAFEPKGIRAGNPKRFSAHVKKLKKEQTTMKTSGRMIKIAVAAAAVLALGVTAYAATTLHWFSFQSGDKFITMNTTESITEAEAKSLVGADAGSLPPEDADVRQADSEEFTFASAAEAGQKLELPLILPQALPEMKLESATGEILRYGEAQTRLCWLNYTDEQGRIFGLTLQKEMVGDGTSITGYTTHEMDDGSLGTYESKSGVKFTTLSESDQSGEHTAHIATALVNNYEYSLVFVGFEESERQAILDSVDLSAYR